MTSLVSIINIAAPLMLVTTAALLSEYAGRMALFLDGAINLGAFLCYMFTCLTGNVTLAVLISTSITCLVTFIFERVATKLNANMFLAGLAMNILFTASVTLVSSIVFGTRGVLYSSLFKFNPATARLITSLICYGLTLFTILFLAFTTPGLSLRICGSDAHVLESKGISSEACRCISWIIAAAFAAVAGCTLSIRLSSYVPGIASGRGWTALAAVFLARKNPFIIAPAVLAFAVAEFLSTSIQNIPLFSSIPSSILLSLPYIFALVLIIIIPQKKQNSEK